MDASIAVRKAFFLPVPSETGPCVGSSSLETLDTLGAAKCWEKEEDFLEVLIRDPRWAGGKVHTGPSDSPTQSQFPLTIHGALSSMVLCPPVSGQRGQAPGEPQKCLPSGLRT